MFDNVSRVFNVSRIKEATKWLDDDREEYTQWVDGPDESGRVVVSVMGDGFMFKVEKIPGPVFRLQGKKNQAVTFFLTSPILETLHADPILYELEQAFNALKDID